MGTDCSPSSSALNCSGYSLVQLLDHPAFGVIYHLRNDANGLELAVKKIVCEGDIMEDSFRRKIELAK